MKHISTLLCLLTLFTISASAQFSIQPQVGLETSKTMINVNGEKISPVGSQFSPKFSLQMNYFFKQGFGVFAGVSTVAASVNYNFSDPGTAATFYNASKGNIQMALQGGLQFASKAIPLSQKKSSFVPHKPAYNFRESGHHFCQGRLNCQHSAMNRCSKFSNKTVAKNNGSYMKFIPSVGLAFIPSQPKEIVVSSQGTQPAYSYRAGAWNTALTAGTGFEFGTNKHPNFVIAVNYMQGLGNLGSKTLNTSSNGKSTATTFSSSTSGFSVSIGIPIGFSKKQAYINKEMERLHERSELQRKCGEYFKSHGCGQHKKTVMQ